MINAELKNFTRLSATDMRSFEVNAGTTEKLSMVTSVPTATMKATPIMDLAGKCKSKFTMKCEVV